MHEITNLWQTIFNHLCDFWQQISQPDKASLIAAWTAVIWQFFGILPTLLAGLATGSIFVLNAIRIRKELKTPKATDGEV